MGQPVDARPNPVSISWVVLTMGTRNAELQSAIGSLSPDDVLVVLNGSSGPTGEPTEASLVLPDNVGVPGGRDAGLLATTSDIVGFLDDDAELRGDTNRVREAFDDDAHLGAVALRLVDETGATARRHVPRLGGRDPERTGEVALFLGGACAVRREAYEEVGGYFVELFYGHEEVELSWRLVDAGWSIRYLADVEVFHPRTTIERHPDGWELTGRNRVLIARRTLPWPVALVHVSAWLMLGLLRAPAAEHRHRYVRGWRRGWRMAVERSPISWRGVWRLVRLGRPPIV
jgi:GT2 family glycosyltransferase